MKKFLKVLMSSALALTMALLTLTGCAQTPDLTVKAPSVSSGSSTTVAQDSQEEQVGLTAGFALNYDAGLVDNDNTQVNIYDSDYYYLNEVRHIGADPGAWYVSEEDALDSYQKLLAREKAMLGERFNQDLFDKEYGTWEYWQEKYANQFFVVTTGSSGTLSAATKQKYPEAIYGLYVIRSSDDLNNWEMCGEIVSGTLSFAVMAESDGWAYSSGLNCWAPEFNRDPVTGLYIICASTNTKSGNASTEYNPHSNTFGYSGEGWDNLNILIAVSPNPVGPYKFITAEEYYQNLAAYNEDGTVKTVEVEENGETKNMAIYRDDLLPELGGDYESGDIVYLTEFKDGEFLNGNGDAVRKDSLPVNAQYYHEKIIEAYPHWFIEGRGLWPNIDVNPVVDSKGDIYLYFSPHTSSVMSANHIWVIKMKDWVTPEWDTLTHIGSPCYSTYYYDGESKEGMKYLRHVKNPDGSYTSYNDDYKAFAINGIAGYYMGSSSEGSINEGTFVIEKDGWYYMTYSPFGYGSRHYSIYLGVSNNPYGPFVKLPDYSPALGVDKFENGDNISGTGHHSFCWAGDELYAVYHCFYNPTDNYDANGGFLGRGLGFDKIAWYDYDGLTFGDIVEEQIEKDLAQEAEEEGKKTRADGMPAEYDFDLTEEWIRDRFIDCNNTDYFGKDADSIQRYDEIVPLMYGNGPTYSLQPLPEVALPDGLGNVADDDDATVEVLYGDTSTVKYANDGMFTFQQWSTDYEVAGNAEAKQLKVKISWTTPKAIRNIMIYNSREYEYGFKSVKSIVFKLAEKPAWYPEGAEYNDYAYIKDLKADPQGWKDADFTMRKGGSAMANFNEITVSEIIITISSEDKIDPSLGKCIVKLSEIYIMGK